MADPEEITGEVQQEDGDLSTLFEGGDETTAGEDTVAEVAGEDTVAGADQPSITDLLQNLAEVIKQTKEPAATPESKPESEAPAEYSFAGVSIPDDVFAALEGDDPALRRKALNHLQSATAAAALGDYNKYVMTQLLPQYTKALVSHIMTNVQQQSTVANARQELFKSNPDLAAFDNPQFNPILQEAHAAAVKKHGTVWSEAVRNEVAAQLRKLKTTIAGKDAAAPKPKTNGVVKLQAGSGVRQTGTTQPKQDGDRLTKEDVANFFR